MHTVETVPRTWNFVFSRASDMQNDLNDTLSGCRAALQLRHMITRVNHRWAAAYYVASGLSVFFSGGNVLCSEHFFLRWARLSYDVQ